MSTAVETQLLPHWIAGEPRTQPGATTGTVTDSATGAVVAQVPFADEALVDQTVAAARIAADDWGRMSVAKRTRILFRFRELLDRHVDDLARIVTREHGKVLDDARGEIARGIEVVEFACGLGHLLKGELTSDVSTGVDAHSRREPLGVVAGISPFNFPVMVPMWMFPVAIACGNAFILKPSEQDPSASLLLAELLAESGLPAGVFSVLQGDRATAEALMEHPHVKAISIVGSTPAARSVYETAARHGKRVQALGGAKNHAVVLPDADLALAADGIVSAAYGSAGQRCMAISVAVAVGDAAEPLLAAVRERAAGLQVGPGTDAASDMGPVISAASRERIVELIDSGVAEGAQLVLDGRGLEVADHADGHFVGPTLFDGVVPSMRVYREEIFGPVLVVVRVETLDEAIALINAGPYGNGATIYTADGASARQFERGVEVGMIGVNVPIPVPVAFYSFGGWKDSLFGDLHMHGPDGIRFYTRGRAVTSRWRPRDAGAATAESMSFPTAQ
ncbi:MAG TPA: CoA-acylating methylmalonate-semialdehyde dehydrogenase [Conexibacter sp.]|nr:CoA-acylating methylmalonate-semialdehyde dehydrogenase [Conexibacter sp.]